METITLQRQENRINLLSNSNAVIAYLADGHETICFDPKADTREAMGWVDFRQVIKDAGLDVITIRAIDAMPGRS